MAANNRSKSAHKNINFNNDSKKLSGYDPNYFSLPHPALGTFTICLVAYLIVVTVSPNSLPNFLWPLTQIGKYMAINHYNFCIGCCCFALISHSLEAAYAGKVSHDRRYTVSVTIKWALSVFIFGFPALIPLQAHKPRSKNA